MGCLVTSLTIWIWFSQIVAYVILSDVEMSTEMNVLVFTVGGTVMKQAVLSLSMIGVAEVEKSNDVPAGSYTLRMMSIVEVVGNLGPLYAMFKTVGQGYLGVGVFAVQFTPAELTEQLSVLIMHHPKVVGRKILAKMTGVRTMLALAAQGRGGDGQVGERMTEAQESAELKEETRVAIQQFRERVKKMIPG